MKIYCANPLFDSAAHAQMAEITTQRLGSFTEKESCETHDSVRQYRTLRNFGEMAVM